MTKMSHRSRITKKTTKNTSVKRSISSSSGKQRKKEEPRPVITSGLLQFSREDESLLNKIFDQVYVISLERRKEKMHLLDFRLRQLKINYRLVRAVDGSSQPHAKQFNNLNKKYGHRPFFTIKSAGAYGLVLTYKHILEEAVKFRYNQILILEDDINFHLEFNELLLLAKKKGLTNFKKHDILWLGANQPRWDKQQRKIIESFDPESKLTSYPVSRHKHTYGTYAIGLGKKAIGALHTYYKSGGPYRHSIDYQIYHLIEKDANSFTGQVLYPNLVVPDVTFSDNKNVREQTEYAKICHWDMSNYQYLSYKDYVELRQAFQTFLGSGRSLRQIFFNHATYLTQEEITSQLGIVNSEWWDKTWRELNPSNDDKISKYTLYHWLEGIDQAFVFVIPSYNNADNYLKNLDSIFNQQYDSHNYRVVYINDASKDNTLSLVLQYLTNKQVLERSHLIDQVRNQKQGSGRWLAFHLCDDDEICCLVDGDDWLLHDGVLEILNQKYRDHQLLASYGCYQIWFKNKLKSNRRGGSNFPEKIMTGKRYRTHRWVSQHLRTARASLFKRIALNDILDHHEGGQFLRMSTDVAEMMPVLEMAGSHHRNIKQNLYVYNQGNSVKYTSSYYRLNEKGNKDNLTYHSQVTKQIQERKPYPTLRFNKVWDQSLGKTKIRLHWLQISQTDQDQVRERNVDLPSTDWPDLNLPATVSWTTDKSSNESKLTVDKLDQSSEWTLVTEVLPDSECLELMITYLKMTQADVFWLEHLNNLGSFVYLTHKGDTTPIWAIQARATKNKKLEFKGLKGFWKTDSLRKYLIKGRSSLNLILYSHDLQHKIEHTPIELEPLKQEPANPPEDPIDETELFDLLSIDDKTMIDPPSHYDDSKSDESENISEPTEPTEPSEPEPIEPTEPEPIEPTEPEPTEPTETESTEPTETEPIKPGSTGLEITEKPVEVVEMSLDSEDE